MLYQLSYASPDSLILLLPKTPRRLQKEGYSNERLSHVKALRNASLRLREQLFCRALEIWQPHSFRM
jgi:hypothetical protein